ncbi:hypothetical protein PR048_007344, partial [Dryococelus australis]
MLTFPPHTSRKLQPLDKTVFGPFKQFYNVAWNEWMLSNPGKPLTIYDVSFEVTWMYPLNENILYHGEYLPSNVTDRPHENHEEVSFALQPGLSTPASDNQVMEAGQSRISPYVVRPFPKALPRKGKGGWEKGKSVIMKETPEKLAIEEEKSKTNNNKTNQGQEKQAEVIPKKKKVKIKLAYSSSKEDLCLTEEVRESDNETFESLLQDIAREEEITEERSLDEDTVKAGDCFVL